ncbi:hypothetical protein ONZ45_g367 [Pleurotus djamor]|nr:hypothetical protein ONZ45_g367 [Pleurotus djamor]
MSVFVSNGLLGGGLGGSSSDNAAPSNALSFQPNGLLALLSESEPNETLQPTSTSTNTVDTTSPPSSSVELPQFVSNGLLSRNDTSTTSIQAPSAFLASSGLRYNVQARSFNGKSVFIRKKSKHAIVNTQPTSAKPIGNLLDVPIHRLMDELSAATAAKLSISNNPATTSNGHSQESPEDTLWVDRYRPNRYIDLIGNERVARDVMSWVKLWDWCVFGRNNKGKKRARDGEEELWDNDEYHRPREKLLLISGPPGLGKTTLAHVVARQAGYEVIEINASDARSGQVVDERIRPTLEAGSTIRSKKPVLLIIDEIDGATGSGESSGTFIHKLVQMTQFKSKKRRTGQKANPHPHKPILRPIICICNDHNAASLAKLRPHAYHIRFSRPADIHTVKRLRSICDAEGLKAETRALGTLVGLTRGDLRSCLNTLQFIRSNRQDVTEDVIRRATAGTRDADNTISAVLNSLFNPITRKRVKELGLTDEEEGRYVSRLNQEIDSVGKESSIATGCFSHYANLRQHDANFSRYEKANEWLGTFDYMSSYMYLEGEFALTAYIPYMLIPFYPLFQERGAVRVERSQTDWEHQQTTKANEEIFKSLAECLRLATGKLGGAYRQFMSSPILEVEFAPFINRIISPPLRPVNRQMVRPEERSLLSRLVDIMASLELRFLQERAEDGQLTYRLDPPIDVFVNYDGKRATDIVVTRYAVRHMVAGEIETKLSKNRVETHEKGKHNKSNPFNLGKSMVSEEANGTSKSSLSNDESPAKRIKTALVEKPPTDFFGRPIDKTTTTKKSAPVRKVKKEFTVNYRYAEGTSAAVRKPVKLDSFFEIAVSFLAVNLRPTVKPVLPPMRLARLPSFPFQKRPHGLATPEVFIERLFYPKLPIMRLAIFTSAILAVAGLANANPTARPRVRGLTVEYVRNLFENLTNSTTRQIFWDNVDPNVQWWVNNPDPAFKTTPISGQFTSLDAFLNGADGVVRNLLAVPLTQTIMSDPIVTYDRAMVEMKTSAEGGDQIAVGLNGVTYTNRYSWVVRFNLTTMKIVEGHSYFDTVELLRLFEPANSTTTTTTAA